jgi:5-deoxy-D-glucuronate isomerase
MHIAPYDNKNKPIVDIDDPTVPLNYFNIVKLTKGQAFEYAVPGFETCIVPATGTVDVDVEGFKCSGWGNALKMFGMESLKVFMFQLRQRLQWFVQVQMQKFLSLVQDMIRYWMHFQYVQMN